jgi:Holliday junction resolvasome RuvABC ATP-dependent DNA helicase subunit
VEIEPAGARAIARRARARPGWPTLLKRVRDYAEVRRGGSSTPVADARSTCSGRPKASIVWTRDPHHVCGPSAAAVGCRPSPWRLGEEADTSRTLRAYLLQRGFLQRTRRGPVRHRRAFSPRLPAGAADPC